MALDNLRESLGELQKRFFSTRPPSDPHRESDRIDGDGMKEIFARAESFAHVGPPTDHTLQPVTSPENVQMRATQTQNPEGQQADIRAAGNSRGLEAARNALVQEAGWSLREAEALKQRVLNGRMTEQQMMRVVEGELQQSATSGQVNPHKGKPPADAKRKQQQQQQAAQQAAGRFSVSETLDRVADMARGGEQR